MAAVSSLPTLTRGLRVLSILARAGPIAAPVIAARLAIPIVSTRRMLAALIREGYCRRVPHSDLYAPTGSVAGIVAEVHRDGLLTGVALDPVADFGRDSDWPLLFATRRGPALVVRVSTMPARGADLDRVRPGATGPLLHGAAGIAQAAFANDRLGEATLAHLPLRDRLGMPALLDRVRAQGYCIHAGAAGRGAIAVPVLVEGLVVGGLSMRFPTRLLGERPLLRVHLPRLRLTAARIADSFVAVRPPTMATRIAEEGHHHAG